MTQTRYQIEERRKQLGLLGDPVTNKLLFDEAIGSGSWCGNKYPWILSCEDSIKNLYAPIRIKALDYFGKYNIAWWGENENKPSGHLLSSQIHCLNHLFALRKDEEAVKEIITKALNIEVDQILPSPLDKDGFITFEFVYKNKSLLGESYETRGKKCTSIDVFVNALLKDGKRLLIPIEWKYTESYEKTVDNRAVSNSVKRYVGLANSGNTNLQKWIEEYEWDPLYEFVRQTLLMEQMSNNYVHVIVRPNDNKEIIADIDRFRNTLKDKAKLIEIDPTSLISPLKDKTEYRPLIDYLIQRYWT